MDNNGLTASDVALLNSDGMNGAGGRSSDYDKHVCLKEDRGAVVRTAPLSAERGQ